MYNGGMALTVLSLNLHCFQEPEPFAKLELIAQAILEHQPDVVALQEAAQDRYAPERLTVEPGVVLREGNAALWLVERLRAAGQDWHGAWDWAHYGWDRWEEGCAVLSRHPIRHAESRYITQGAHTDFWKSRKPVAAVIDVAGVGPLAVFSVHLGWWDDADEPFAACLQRLRSWQAEHLLRHGLDRSQLLTAGDFNIEAGTEGYNFLVETGPWRDAWLEAEPDGMLVPTIGGAIDGWENAPGALRIDYVFLEQASPLRVTCMERLFTGAEIRVSDHVGLLVRLDSHRFLTKLA